MSELRVQQVPDFERVEAVGDHPVDQQLLRRRRVVAGEAPRRAVYPVT